MSNVNNSGNNDDNEKKRHRVVGSSANKENDHRGDIDSAATADVIHGGDPIIGLDVCGTIYYCHQSTLVQSSSYFAKSFSRQF